MISYIFMKPEHVSQIAELEKQCFSLPWSERSVYAELDNPISLWIVAVLGEKVVGYVGSQSVLDEADMMNIAVYPDFRRQGIAERLVKALCEGLRERHVRCLTLEVRASNEPARSLYEKLGFSQVGRRPNYYKEPKEDALILRKEWQV